MSPSREELVAEERAALESERIVAWLRLVAIALIGTRQWVDEPSPAAEAAFLEALIGVSAWSVLVLVFVYVRPVTRRVALMTAAADIGAITALVVLSGGAFSDVRVAYVFIPITVAFRFGPLVTGIVSAATVAAYLVQAVLDPAASLPQAEQFAAIQAGYLAWIGLAATLLSHVLTRRTARIAELAGQRSRLIARTLTAEERERKVLAEGLHDHAIQNLLSARHDIEEASGGSQPVLARAERAIDATIRDLREAVFELHPYVLEAAGLEAALRSAGERAARRGGFDLHVSVDFQGSHPEERLLLAAARELLANAAAHSGARSVWLSLGSENGQLVLVLRDDGHGFDPSADRTGEGHIGLAAQRERVTSAGGQLEIDAQPGRGTRVSVRLPA